VVFATRTTHNNGGVKCGLVKYVDCYLTSTNYPARRTVNPRGTLYLKVKPKVFVNFLFASSKIFGIFKQKR